MKASITNVKYLALVLYSILLGCNCQSKNKAITTYDSNNSQVSLNTLTAVIDSVDQEIKNGEYGLIDHFMLIHNEKVIADFSYKNDYKSIAQNYDTSNHQYNYNHPDWHPYYKNTKLHTLQSVTKSVTSIIMGIALESNPDYDLNTKAMTFFDKYSIEKKDERWQEMTIEDLLTMRSGLKWNEGEYLDMTDDCIAMEASDDWIQYVLDKTFDSNPGEKFVYNSGVSVLIGKIVQEVVGIRIDKYAEEILFEPLGISDYYWKKTPKGEMDTEGGLYLKAKDLAKIGKLFLDQGKWNGQPIVPENWIKSSVTPKATNLYPEEPVDVGYGYQWWTESYKNGINIFSANGYGGQYLMVVPDEKLFVVFNGWNINEQPEKSAFNVLVNRILPALKQNQE